MFIFKQIEDLQKYLKAHTAIGFVPTMGALHEGHLSLIKHSKAENGLTVCSIFVNPTQFNDPKDFEKYPITIESDIELLHDAGCDVLFLPEVAEMYPDGIGAIRQYEIGFLDTVFDGKHRPGHFNGVCVIVHKLLDAVKPHRLYLGEKDFQQCLVIKQLVTTEQIPTEVITCPTLRTELGLAMSSRNARLSEMQREEAALIYRLLNGIKVRQKSFTFEELQRDALQQLTDAGFNTEYLMLANAETLEEMKEFDHQKKMVLLIASFFHGVRLIDNLRVN